VPPLGEDADEAIASYLDDLIAVIDEAAVMAEAPCEDLQQAVRDNPNVFRSVRGFAAALKRVAAQQPDMAEEVAVQDALAELDATLSQLEAALMLCGIPLT
jgi:hypothetical protein